ncbi:MAG: M28 family metallopeptidase, partial [Candidatus Aenigmatarchaeota archaeon]
VFTFITILFNRFIMEFNVERAFRDLKNLDFPRFAGTEGEKKAREYIRREFEKTGFEVNGEKFTYFPSMRIFRKLSHILQAFLFLSIGYFITINPLTSFILSIVLLIYLFITTRWAKFLGSSLLFGKKGTSENIIASHRGSDTDKKVILMAHYDTKSELLPIRLRIVILTVSIVGGMFYSLAALGASFGSMFLSFPIFSDPFLYGGIFLFAITLLLAFNRTGNKSPGIADDGSGLAVMLELARILSENPPENLDIDFVASGVEEIALAGSINYLKKHDEKMDRENTFLIILDLLGSGELRYNSSFGIPMKKTSQRLNKLIEESAEEEGINMGKKYYPTGLAADHMSFVERGFEATWLLSSMPGVHTKRDDIEAIDENTLINAGRVVNGVISKLENVEFSQYGSNK